MNIELAWKVIDNWVEKDYGNNKADAEDEMGNLDDLALRISEIIDINGYSERDDLTWLSSQIEMDIF